MESYPVLNRSLDWRPPNLLVFCDFVLGIRESSSLMVLKVFKCPQFFIQKLSFGGFVFVFSWFLFVWLCFVWSYELGDPEKTVCPTRKTECAFPFGDVCNCDTGKRKQLSERINEIIPCYLDPMHIPVNNWVKKWPVILQSINDTYIT